MAFFEQRFFERCVETLIILLLPEMRRYEERARAVISPPKLRRAKDIHVKLQPIFGEQLTR